MVVLGTFVDSLAILLVFAPVAVELCKRYGIAPIQMGVVMVICNQIGAVSPPTAPLLFVYQHRPDHARRHQPARLDLLHRRVPRAAAGHLRSRPLELDPAVLPGVGCSAHGGTARCLHSVVCST